MLIGTYKVHVSLILEIDHLTLLFFFVLKARKKDIYKLSSPAFLLD